MIPEFKSVLYCTDLSDNSSAAFTYAIAVAKTTGADIHIMHVLERLSEDAIITLRAFMQDEEQRKAAIYDRAERSKAILDDRQEKFWTEVDAADKNLRAQIKSVEVVESYPAEAILQRSKERNCDMIIMGGHARGVSHNFLGSVAKSVLRRSSIPVLIVPLLNV
jgi:nucleotide-binding universal stress UspA family protein